MAGRWGARCWVEWMGGAILSTGHATQERCTLVFVQRAVRAVSSSTHDRRPAHQSDGAGLRFLLGAHPSTAILARALAIAPLHPCQDRILDGGIVLDEPIASYSEAYLRLY